ncbi:hypothetical protein ACWT_4852 [Actinoplanes sp. SE50]|nr:hypothetical protein ACPL_4982 [Actinoplanes sp. SE50/110]ATO84267.1 hypothetical protein ACWT_4852 [Actinoplanes sp. SE50]SLM01677.1 hypothetical protein ACSP50_4913 [Actinoplanes sp. SE50/110]
MEWRESRGSWPSDVDEIRSRIAKVPVGTLGHLVAEIVPAGLGDEWERMFGAGAAVVDPGTD